MRGPTLIFTIRDHALTAVDLRVKGITVETLTFSERGHLDEVLIPQLDAFLRRHRINPREIAKVTIHAGPIDRNSSAYRIVHTWAAALKAAQNHNK